MARTIEWFKRLADVPAVGYEPPRPVPRPALRNARPQVVSFDDGPGRTTRSLMWPSEGGGETSASPAASHRLGDSRNSTTSEVVTNLRETLEVPGEASDYHFALQDAADALWSRRREDPGLLEIIIELYVLDIRLIEARPEAITAEYSDQTSFYSVTAFTRLVDVYLREGLVPEALAIARSARRFRQTVDLEELETQVSVLEAEPRP